MRFGFPPPKGLVRWIMYGPVAAFIILTYVSAYFARRNRQS